MSHTTNRRDNFMHARNLREMVELHKQLNTVIMRHPQNELQRQRQERSSGSSSNGASPPPDGGLANQLAAVALSLGEGLMAASHRPPSAAVQQCLRRAMAAGWADQVRGGLVICTFLACGRNCTWSLLATSITHHIGDAMINHIIRGNRFSLVRLLAAGWVGQSGLDWSVVSTTAFLLK